MMSVEDLDMLVQKRLDPALDIGTFTIPRKEWRQSSTKPIKEIKAAKMQKDKVLHEGPALVWKSTSPKESRDRLR